MKIFFEYIQHFHALQNWQPFLWLQGVGNPQLLMNVIIQYQFQHVKPRQGHGIGERKHQSIHLCQTIKL